MTIKKRPVSVRIATWENDKEKLSEVRRIVFIDEQKVPKQMEWDGEDESSIHYLAEIDDNTVAVARLKPDGQLGRMAVLKEYRNQGIGHKLLQFIINGLNSRKDIYLHAQVSAIPFYKKNGFIECEDIFYEADIPHKKMLLED